jgi:hypothetical protein
MNTVLDVVAVVSNPCRYHSRARLFDAFAQRVAEAGARLTIVEASFGDRDPAHVYGTANYVGVRTNHELWHKENLINLGIARLPADWRYVAWIDADLTFARPDWAKETVEQFQHFSVVQMWSHAIDLGPQHETMATHMGFGYAHVHRKPVNHSNAPYEFWHPGFAWAARREFVERVGGLVDWTLLGAADHIMACAILGYGASGLRGKAVHAAEHAGESPERAVNHDHAGRLSRSPGLQRDARRCEKVVWRHRGRRGQVHDRNG